jgi:hypothetical protein
MPPRPCRPKFQNELAQGLRNEPDTLNPPGEMARFKADVTGIGSDQCPVWHNCTWALTTESSGEGGYRNLASAAIMGDARIPHGRIGTARFRRERLGAQLGRQRVPTLRASLVSRFRGDPIPIKSRMAFFWTPSPNSKCVSTSSVAQLKPSSDARLRSGKETSYRRTAKASRKAHLLWKERRTGTNSPMFSQNYERESHFLDLSVSMSATPVLTRKSINYSRT